MRRILLVPTLSLALALGASAALADTTLPLTSHETFLRLDPTDTASGPLVVKLSDYGFVPGNVLRILPLGDFDNGPGGDEFNILVAVFSSTSTVLSPAVQYRVPDAVSAGLNATTGLTCPSNYPTDLPFDFYVTAAGVDVTVPVGAAYLFVMTGDCYFIDNSDPDGDFAVRLSNPTLGVEPHADLSLQLLAPRPNPVRAGATFGFRAPGGNLSLALYSADGRRVRTLVSGAAEAGMRFVAWDGRDDRGGVLPAGIYFARLAGDRGSVERKVVLTR